MENLTLSPKEITESTIKKGVAKTNLRPIQTFLLAILAGFFVGLGSHVYTIITAYGDNVPKGLLKFAGASLFPVGIILVLIAGAELFTGNCLISLSVMDKKNSLMKMIKNLIIVYVGNFVGSITLALMIANSGMYEPGSKLAQNAIKIAEYKMGHTITQALILSILCNILVTLAVWLAYGSKDTIGKIFGMWFPVTLFVIAGFEHSIANMYFLPIAKFVGGNFTFIDIFTKNILIVTLGNVIGGAIIVPSFYYLTYIKLNKQK